MGLEGLGAEIKPEKRPCGDGGGVSEGRSPQRDPRAEVTAHPRAEAAAARPSSRLGLERSALLRSERQDDEAIPDLLYYYTNNNSLGGRTGKLGAGPGGLWAVQVPRCPGLLQGAHGGSNAQGRV